jgi:hypothetical protein
MIISNYIHSYLTYQKCERRTNLNIHILFNCFNPFNQVTTEKNSWKYLLSKLECAYTLGTMLEMNLSLFHGFGPNRFGPETKPFQQRVTGHHPY